MAERVISDTAAMDLIVATLNSVIDAGRAFIEIYNIVDMTGREVDE